MPLIHWKYMKEKIEVFEKLLIVITLIVGIGVSVNKGFDYISAKSEVVNAMAAQERETANAQHLLTETYAKLLTNLDVDIREIDKKLDDEVYNGTVGWDKLILIRAEKVKDRNQLLLTLGEQVVNMRGMKPTASNLNVVTP
jgi:hypothetical protein